MSDCVLASTKPRLNGYAYVYVRSTGYGHGDSHEQLAHRHAWERAHGPIPDGHEVHHRCENKRCVNVAHLACVPWEEHRGKGGHGKLNREDAEEIRRLRAAGVRGATVARRFGVSEQQVCNVVKRRCWA